MFLEVLCRVVAKPLFDLVREAVQISVAIDVESWQQLDDVEDVGDQRTVKPRFRFRSTRSTICATASRTRRHKSSAIGFLFRVHLGARPLQRIFVLFHLLRRGRLRRFGGLLRAQRSRVALSHYLQKGLEEDGPQDEIEN